MSGFPGGSDLSLVTVDEIRAAADRLVGVIVPTPLVPFPGVEPALLVKPESLQPIGSFKLRGAYAAISALPSAVRARGVVAHSSGNHAQAVAYAAALLGIPAVVVIPANAPAVKVAATRRMGARIVPVQPTLAARVAAAEDLISRHGFTLIPPFDHRAVIAGQGTIGLEIAAQCPETDLVVVPVGGGGLISGISAAIRRLRPGAKVVGVEPELAADARDSLRRRERVAWPAASTQRTIADSLRVEQVGALPFEHILSYVDDIVTVSEDEIREAVRRIAVEAHLIAEPGGAVAVAACLLRTQDLPAARAPVAVLSGGNIDPRVLAGLLGGDGEHRDSGGLPGWGWSGSAVVGRRGAPPHHRGSTTKAARSAYTRLWPVFSGRAPNRGCALWKGSAKLALGEILYACHSPLLHRQDLAVCRRHRARLSCGRAWVAAACAWPGHQRDRELCPAVAPAGRDVQVAGRLDARVPVPDRRGRAHRGRRLS
ncbi:MAG TPA: threonine/serine dehydratase, partial [Streptosporangiaceae bacterium]